MALVGLARVDILVALLHPTARGPLSDVANRATWSATKTVSDRFLGDGA